MELEGSIPMEAKLQDIFLNEARKKRIGITLYLTNGFQFKGMVKGFDNYTIVVESDGNQFLVYKHAVSTIGLSKNIAIPIESEK